MDWLTWILFESPAALGATLFVVLFGLVVLWRRGGDPRPILFGLGLAAVLFLVQFLVVTNREHAARILDRIEKELLTSRTAALEAVLTPDFHLADLDRDAFLGLVRRQLEHVRFRWVERTRLEIRDAGADHFIAHADYLAEVNADRITHVARSAWEITFVRGAGGWLVAEIRCVHIDGAADLLRA